MSKKVQAKLDSPPHLVYHSGMIKILLKSALDRNNKSWDRFIIEEGFTSLTQKKKLGGPIKSIKNMQSPMSPNPQIVVEQQSPPDISSSKAQSIPKNKTPFPKKKSTLKGSVPSSSGLKDVSTIYKRR